MRLPDGDRSSAVLIGAADYTHTSNALPALPQIHNNLMQLGAVLTDPRSGGFHARRTHLILNPPDSRTVYDVLRRASADSTDTLLVYYAGHGLLDVPGRLHLALAATDPEHPDTSISALPITIVKQVLAESGADHRILILDCCFSGRAADAYMGPATEVALRQAEVDGAIIIASAPANEASLAVPGEPYTAFTGELIRLLRTDGSDHEQPSGLQALFDELARTATDRGFPRPRWLSNLSHVDLALTRAADSAAPRPEKPTDRAVGPAPLQPVAESPSGPRAAGPSVATAPDDLASTKPPMHVAARQRSGRAEKDAALPYFYLSYARTPRVDPDDEVDPDHWAHKLFRDLSREVMEQTAFPGYAQPGFMDRGMHAGVDWPRRIGDALATCRVLVPLYSPRYFTSEFCGREWTAFDRRPVSGLGGAPAFIVPIVPVWWIPVDMANLPLAARRIQFDHHSISSTGYLEHGLSVMARTRQFSDEYTLVVHRLATRANDKVILCLGWGRFVRPVWRSLWSGSPELQAGTTSLDHSGVYADDPWSCRARRRILPDSGRSRPVRR